MSELGWDYCTISISLSLCFSCLPLAREKVNQMIGKLSQKKTGVRLTSLQVRHTHTHAALQKLRACVCVYVCLCVHTVKHFQHLINQLLTWQVDWHVLHLLLLSVSCLTHAHTHICEHTLDIERQWEALICISWTWHTHTHTHSLLLSCPILVPKSSVIMTQYKNSDQLCHNVPRSRNHLCTIKTRGRGTQNGKKVFFVFSHEKRYQIHIFFPDDIKKESAASLPPYQALNCFPFEDGRGHHLLIKRNSLVCI